MGANRMPVDPDAGIPDLVRRLRDDSRRLMGDEVRLAKLELEENVKRGGSGTMLLGVAFGIGVIAAVMATLCLATLVGRLAGGHMWVGALVTAAVELGLAVMLVKRGFAAFAAPSYSLEQTRAAIQGGGLRVEG